MARNFILNLILWQLIAHLIHSCLKSSQIIVLQAVILTILYVF